MQEDNKITFKKIVIPKEEVKRMNPLQKKRYIMLSNILRDLGLLQRFFLFVNNNRMCDEDKDEQVCVDATAVTILFFLQTLISKNYEIKKFIYENKIAQDQHKFPPKVKAVFEQMEHFYTDHKVTVLFEFVRHKFGFHYEYQNDIDVMLDQIMDGSRELVVWLSEEDNSNVVFATSNEITLSAIFNKMEELGYVSEHAANQKEFFMDELLKLALKSSQLSRDFCIHYLVEEVLNNIRFQEGPGVIVSAPMMSSIRLPSIVKNDKESSQNQPNSTR